ncbi:MAG: long-chain fatty acid--CoA ligase [Bacteroides sp.]|nr:long-chain fatty acid--CoA ligase [Prevotella sp.]MCM1408258.1 long-chain fatty acid--CoA ligase [Treponema brennaborense]MCM1470510.1 long-chain fatty acid--CoA ligase [Bacteroides sp.]
MKKFTFNKDLPENLPLLFKMRTEQCSNIYFQAAKDASGTYQYYTYASVYDNVIALAAELRALGVSRSEAVAIISDNRREWFITDMALLSLGAADVPRGCDSMGAEIRFIIAYTNCSVGFFENGKQLAKVLEKAEDVPLLKTAVLYEQLTEEQSAKAAAAGITVRYFAEMLDSGQKKLMVKNGSPSGKALRAAIEAEMEKTSADDVATIIFTSGTTGTPKGVMLTHRNYLTQLSVMHNFLPCKPGDWWMSVLPVWHSFERAFQYIAFLLKCGIAYSKPAAPILLADLAAVRPHWMCGVPRLWDSVAQGIMRSARKKGGIQFMLFKFFIRAGKRYALARDMVTGCICRLHKRSRIADFLTGVLSYILLLPIHGLGEILVYRGIRAKLGGRMTAAISGGGSLQKDTDAFYRAIGFKLLEGYGLTETAPVLSLRYYKKPRPGCVGAVLPCVEIKIVAEQNGVPSSSEPLPPGKRGLIFARGPQIMKGYYKRPDLTAQIIDKDGWLNTGDLGMLTYDNEIKITGRAKDTIVLLGGENVEPGIIESALRESQYIETAVVLGQDQKYLGALIVPSKEACVSYAEENGIETMAYDQLLESNEIRELINHEIYTRVSAENGFRLCEKIFRFELLPDSFAVGSELSGKQELMRPKIAAKYKKQIEKLFV